MARVGQTQFPAGIRASFGITDDEPVAEMVGGRINSTLVVGAPPRMVLQRLNGEYFADPQRVMENLFRVVGHLDWKHQIGSPGEPRWFPTLLPTTVGKPYTIDDDGGVWRAYRYLDGEVAKEAASDDAIASIVAIYGRFTAAMDDFDGPELAETFVEFRATDRIVSEFVDLHANAAAERQAMVTPLRSRMFELFEQIDALTAPLIERGLRTRVLHNDTKLKNVLLAPGTDVASAVVDYDLVMPGYVMDDFGDVVRSASHHRAAGGFDVAFFELMARSFLSTAGQILDADEVVSLAAGPARICVQLACRYLTDPLRESPALRVTDPAGAIGKAELNLTLAEQLVGNADALTAVVTDLAP